MVEKGDRAIQVKNGNESHTIQGTRELTIDGKATHTNKADFTQQVSGNFFPTDRWQLNPRRQGFNCQQVGQSINLTTGMTLTSKVSATQTVDGGGLLALQGCIVKIN